MSKCIKSLKQYLAWARVNACLATIIIKPKMPIKVLSSSHTHSHYILEWSQGLEKNTKKERAVKVNW